MKGSIPTRTTTPRTACLPGTRVAGDAGFYHLGRVNVLFADGHVRAFNSFEGSEMTYSYDQPGLDFDLTEPK
ncbi:MAG: H-X9-DG-CTERM domain-containing protein [Verrucomicrobiia bacterium]